MPRRWTLAAFVLAVACALAATWPAASSPTDTILCNYVHPDCLSNHWLMVWVAERVRDGASILHNDRYYWPIGDAPWLAGNGSEGFAYLPFHLAFGWPLGSTIYLVGLLALNGVAFYTLARASGASPAASLAAAPTGALLLYAIHELGAGRFSQVSVFWMAFFLAAWLRFLAKPTVLGALGAAALLALTCVFYWYYGLFSVLAGAILLLAHASPSSRPPLRALVIFSVAFLVAIAPLFYVFVSYWSSIPGTAEDVFPHPESVGDSTWPGIPFLVAGGRHAGRALPLTTVLFACAALFDRARRRIVLAWWAVALFFAALMAGALIPHGPYELIYGLAGPLRRFWWPYRHVVVLNLALVTLAALGAQYVFGWIGARIATRFGASRSARLTGALFVAVALSVPAQLIVQGAPWHAQFSKTDLSDDFYRNLRDTPGTILVEPPLSPGVASAQTPLVYQLLHGKTLLAGHAMWVERVRPDAWDAYVAANSFLTALQHLEQAELGEAVTFEARDLRALVDAGARTFVVNQEYFPVVMRPLVNSYDKLFATLFGEPIATGRRVKAWDAAAWADGATSAAAPLDGPVTVAIPAFAWPPRLRQGGPTLSLQAPRPPSLVFSVPPPEKPDPRKKE